MAAEPSTCLERGFEDRLLVEESRPGCRSRGLLSSAESGAPITRRRCLVAKTTLADLAQASKVYRMCQRHRVKASAGPGRECVYCAAVTSWSQQNPKIKISAGRILYDNWLEGIAVGECWGKHEVSGATDSPPAASIAEMMQFSAGPKLRTRRHSCTLL